MSEVSCQGSVSYTHLIQLLAKWIGQSSIKYTVIHWQQNADDDGYSFVESQELTGKAGEYTNARSKSYSGFKAGNLHQKEIAGDGSTIINIYYDRNVYQVYFYEYEGRPIRDWVKIEKLTISAKYGPVSYTHLRSANWSAPRTRLSILPPTVRMIKPCITGLLPVRTQAGTRHLQRMAVLDVYKRQIVIPVLK